MENITAVGMNGPRKGVRVLDWTVYQFGPAAPLIMGDMGANVVNIEPLDGDVGRSIARMSSRPIGLEGVRKAYFETCNKNKRAITITFKTAKVRKLVNKLVEFAGVFIENYRQGVPEKLEMDYDSLKKTNPKLIYASGTGYGPLGPNPAKQDLA